MLCREETFLEKETITCSLIRNALLNGKKWEESGE
jgi:hypothetical protein